MKSTKIFLAAAAMALSFGAYSQTDSTKKDSAAHKMDTTKKRPELTESGAIKSFNDKVGMAPQTGANSTMQGANGTATGTTTSATSNVPKPNFGRYYIPVLGTFNAVASTADSKTLKVTADESNPGKIWVEGLTDTKFYALLRTAPGTYKIPAQKQDDKSIAEGTLIYDETNKQISVCTGCGFDQAAPAVTDQVAAAEATPETAKNKKSNKQTAKTKKVQIISFTGTKAEEGTVSLLQ